MSCKPINPWWHAPPLSGDEGRLVDAYRAFADGLDFRELPYTGRFEAVRNLMGVEDSAEGRRFLWLRLLRLHQMGRL